MSSGYRVLTAPKTTRKSTGQTAVTPPDCPAPVRWVGQAMVGRKRMRLWSCGRHVQGLGELSAVQLA